MPTPPPPPQQQAQWRPPLDPSWERSPIAVIPTPKWCESERARDQVYRETKDSRDWKDRDRDARERERDKRREKKEAKNNKKKEKEAATIAGEEEQKKLDLDTRFYFKFLNLTAVVNLIFEFDRIALLLKGKGPGGMAPPFLSLGVDSDDESKGILSNKPISIPTSIDSDDGKNIF